MLVKSLIWLSFRFLSLSLIECFNSQFTTNKIFLFFIPKIYRRTCLFFSYHIFSLLEDLSLLVNIYIHRRKQDSILFFSSPFFFLLISLTRAENRINSKIFWKREKKTRARENQVKGKFRFIFQKKMQHNKWKHVITCDF